MKFPSRSLLAACLVACVAQAASAASVEINGRSVGISPPPIERAGRIFVPLRGVFERLGASVVYTKGFITATGRDGKMIEMCVGSRDAYIANVHRQIDVAPFIVGASTYVPLRFIAQSFGAVVNYDDATHVVGIVDRSDQRRATAAPRVHLLRITPADGSRLSAMRPTISADFSFPVAPDTLRVALDDLDVTSQTTRTPSGIVFAPPSPLQPMSHRVVVKGVTRAGERFERSWSFTTGDAAPSAVLRLDTPLDGEVTGGSFTVTGRALPDSRIHIIATALGERADRTVSGNYSSDLDADSRGYFRQPVTLSVIPGSRIDLSVTAIDPASHEKVERTLRLRTN